MLGIMMETSEMGRAQQQNGVGVYRSFKKLMRVDRWLASMFYEEIASLFEIQVWVFF